MSQPPATTGRKCYLLALPAELRTYIWELCLAVHEDPNKLVTIVRSSDCTSKPNPPRTLLAFLATCHEINNEAAGIFYNINRLSMDAFEFGPFGPYGSNGFLTHVTPKRLAGIQNLTIACDRTHQSLEILSSACKRIGGAMPRLQRLTCQFVDILYQFFAESVEREKFWLLRGLKKMGALEIVTVVQSKPLFLETDETRKWKRELGILAGRLEAAWTKQSGGEKKVFEFEYV